MTIQPRVVDMFHGDVLYSDQHKTSAVADFKNMATAGIWGMIHKATQGINYTDPAYTARTKAARQAGLLTGAYHFNTGDTAAGQVNYFFDAVQPDKQTLMCLDWEDNTPSQMPLALAAQFLQLADEQLGRTVWLYGGNRPKELLSDASSEIRELFGKRSWWLCEYADAPVVTDYNHNPMPWPTYTIWQFSADGLGPLPHTLPGVITEGIDLNTFNGTKQQLALVWPGNALTTPLTS